MENIAQNGKIDIVIPWVDGNDPLWQAEKCRHKGDCRTPEGFSDIRFNDWGLLRHWFRAVETCLPWFNKIFFITWGHLPDFLDTGHGRLRVVKHSDYIPAEFLPTFNSNTIELNLFRIEDLSENFILFNDDLFPLSYFPEEYFFMDGKPCDEAVESVIISKGMGLKVGKNMYLNNMEIINRNFIKKECQAAHPDIWFSPCYGEDYLKRNRLMRYWEFFAGFTNKHMANPYKKSVFRKIYGKERGAFDTTFRNRFRWNTDITHWLVRYWQLCEGCIHPRLTLGKSYLLHPHAVEEIAREIESRAHPMVCINEVCTAEEFVPMKSRMQRAFEKLFPNPSSFERARGGVRKYSVVRSAPAARRAALRREAA